jgi:hypothetical protein
MMDIDQLLIDAVADEVCPNIYVFHLRMWVRVVRARDGPFVITIQYGGLFLIELELLEKGAEPNDVTCAMRA